MAIKKNITKKAAKPASKKALKKPVTPLDSTPCSDNFYAEHNVLRREGFITRPGNLDCAFKPGTHPLICRPVTRETGKLLLPNARK